MDVTVKRFDTSLPLPEYHGEAACFDFYCREARVIAPGKIEMVPINMAVQVPKGYALLIFLRSSTPIRKGLMMANSVAVIDPFFCGDQDEMIIQLYNCTDQPISVEKGDRLAQGMFVRHEPATWQEVSQMSSDGVGGYNTQPGVGGSRKIR